MHEIEGESVISLALSAKLNNRVLAARAHINHCPVCAQTLAQAVTETIIAEPDIEQKPLWSWTAAKTLLIQFTETTLQAFRKSSSPALGIRHLSSGVEEYHYVIEDETEGFGVEIEIDHEDQAETCTLTLKVAQSGKPNAQNLSGALVTLAWNDSETQTRSTNTYGLAIFEEIPFNALETLSLEIEPPT